MSADGNSNGNGSGKQEPIGAKDNSQFFSVVKDLKKKWKKDFKPKVGQDLRNPPEVIKPTKFEDISICAQGPCKYLFSAKIPVDINIPDPTNPGGIRKMMATVRRCLAGVIELPSDEPTPTGMLRKGSDEAPIAVECSHYLPLTDDEVIERETRLLVARERAKRGFPVPSVSEKDKADLEEAIRLRDAEDDLSELKEEK